MQGEKIVLGEFCTFKAITYGKEKGRALIDWAQRPPYSDNKNRLQRLQILCQAHTYHSIIVIMPDYLRVRHPQLGIVNRLQAGQPEKILLLLIDD